MTVTARFVRGSRTFDLVYPYALSGFVPPSVRPDYNITSGTSANRTGGGELIGVKYSNRSLSFGVRVLGTSRAQMEASVRRLQLFVSGMTGETAYFEYRDNDMPTPLYGQFGASLRYEIVTAEAYYDGQYQSDRLRQNGLIVGVALTVKPFALGSRQKLATASGAVVEDVLGVADGVSRGLLVLEATTNKMTNPVFGSATWDTGWTTQANVISAQNTDPDFVFPGANVSAKLTNKASGNTLFYQSINVGNTNAHYLTAYVIKHDRSAVTAADCRLYYGALATTTITSLNNGVYMLSAPVTGVNAATVTGISVTAKATLYLLGMQLEEKAYPTPLCFGDQLGCAWTGTAHASTSTRTAGRVTVPTADTFSAGQGTIAWAVKMPLVSTLQPTWVFWDMAGVDFRAYWQLSDAKFYFDDDTNVIAGAATSFSAGDVLIFHATWSNSGLKLYLNGVEVATGATYTTPTIGATFDIGRDEAGNPGGGAVMGWTAYDVALTAQQVAAQAAAASAWAGLDRRVDFIPWLWTKDGDNVVDNCNDSTRNNWAIAAGIPGSDEAITELEVTSSASFSSSSLRGLILSNFATEDFINPSNLTFDRSGTADATACGGEVETLSVGTTLTYFTSDDLTAVLAKAMAGHEVYVVARLSDAGSNLVIGYSIFVGGDSSQQAENRTVNSAAYFLPRLTNSLTFPDLKNDVTDFTFNVTSGVYFWALRTTGTANLTVDFFQALPRPIVMFDVSSASGLNTIMYDSRGKVYNYSYSAKAIGTSNIETFGDCFELSPRKYNEITAVSGSTKYNVSVVAVTVGLTFQTVAVTPRWGLI